MLNKNPVLVSCILCSSPLPRSEWTVQYSQISRPATFNKTWKIYAHVSMIEYVIIIYANNKLAAANGNDMVMNTTICVQAQTANNFSRLFTFEIARLP